MNFDIQDGIGTHWRRWHNVNKYVIILTAMG